MYALCRLFTSYLFLLLWLLLLLFKYLIHIKLLVTPMLEMELVIFL